MVGGAHVPSLLNTCVLGEMAALWPARYAATSARADGRRSDVSVGSILSPIRPGVSRHACGALPLSAADTGPAGIDTGSLSQKIPPPRYY